MGGDARAGLHHKRLPRHFRDPIQELVRRAGQPRDATIPLVEDAVRCPIRLGGFAAAEREDAVLVVEDRAAGLREPDVALRRLDTRRGLDLLGAAIATWASLRPHVLESLPVRAGQTDGHVADLHDRFSIGVHERIGLCVRFRPIAQLTQVDLVRNHLRGGEHLPPAPKPAFDVHDRLPGRALGLRDPTHAQEKDAERMQAAFVH